MFAKMQRMEEEQRRTQEKLRQAEQDLKAMKQHIPQDEETVVSGDNQSQVQLKANSATRSRDTANSAPLRQLSERTIQDIGALSADVKTMKSILDEHDTAIAVNMTVVLMNLELKGGAKQRTPKS